jgi:N6-adenosine-specific RNA methylase IME4
MTKYGAILADPPWKFAVYSARGEGRSASQHYATEGHDTLASIPVGEWAADDCALFMWATDPMLPQALELMRAWGFTYKTVGFYWTKRNADGSPFTGMGYWTRANPEQCLLGTRGHPERLHKDVRRWIDSPRREHSRKPDEIYDRIERLVGGPYLEIFARQTKAGWDAWGNEAGKFGEVA